VLYVGKAQSLRSRVRSYWQKRLGQLVEAPANDRRSSVGSTREANRPLLERSPEVGPA